MTKCAEMYHNMSNTNETDCNRLHPDLKDYYLNLSPFLTLSIFVSILLVILNILIFFTTVQKLRRRLDRKPFLHSSITLCALYPIIAIAALTTILLPYTWLACHTVMHLSFTIGAVIFRKLCFRYVDNEVNFIKETDGEPVSIITPPCCCCCLCLPLVIPSKSKLCMLRYMVWQMPFVQGSIMFVLNGIYYKEPELFANVSIYFIPFIVCSIIFGIWSLNITVGMINGIRADYCLKKKMFALQLILLLCKLQYLVLDKVLDGLELSTLYPINHTIHKQTIINLLILVEMVLVSMLAQNAYKVPVQIAAINDDKLV